MRAVSTADAGQRLCDNPSEVGALPTDEEAALTEAEEAIEHVQGGGDPIELAPQNSFVRRLQHQMVEGAQLLSESVGVEPKRRIRVSSRR